MIILWLKMAQDTSPFSVTSNQSILEKMPKFEKLAKFTKLQKCGFWGICVFQLWDLGRVVRTDMNYAIKLDEKLIGRSQKALKQILEIIS
jgi:hypothetical protein